MSSSRLKKQIFIVLKNTTSGSFTTLTTTGAATIGTTLLVGGQDIQSSLASRVPAQTLVFNGVTSIPITRTAPGTNPFTILFPVVNCSTFVGDPRLIATGSAGIVFQMFVGSTTGLPYFYTPGGNVTGPALTVSKAASLAFVNSGGTATVYTNGVAGTPGAVTANLSSPLTTIGAISGTSYFSGALTPPVEINAALTAAEISAYVTTGTLPSWVVVAAGSAAPAGTATTSGALVVSKKYRITNFVAGDDFTNVGAASNATGVEFVATGTTPTTWTNASTLTVLGALCYPDPHANGTGNIWYDASGNGANITLPASGVTWGQPAADTFPVKNLVASGALTTAAPVGGTAAAWKGGIYVAGAPTVTGYVQLDVAGTLYKVAVST
jgi:hypothetical protein